MGGGSLSKVWLVFCYWDGAIPGPASSLLPAPLPFAVGLGIFLTQGVGGWFRPLLLPWEFGPMTGFGL